MIRLRIGLTLVIGNGFKLNVAKPGFDTKGYKRSAYDAHTSILNFKSVPLTTITHTTTRNGIYSSNFLYIKFTPFQSLYCHFEMSNASALHKASELSHKEILKTTDAGPSLCSWCSPDLLVLFMSTSFTSRDFAFTRSTSVQTAPKATYLQLFEVKTFNRFASPAGTPIMSVTI